MTKATRSLIASEKGIERARKALIDLGITQTILETRTVLAKSTISSFFNGKPIDHTNFTKICKTLNLEWEEIVEKDNPMKLDNCQIENIADIEANSPRLAAFVIEGSFPVDDLTRAKIQALVKQLQKITGDASLEIVDIQKGSIKIILKGTLEALSMIQDLYDSGQLEKLFKKADLSGVDLRRADLSRVDLRRAKLSSANFFSANLSGADLSGVDLSGANLFIADLSGAHLSESDLSGAHLSGSDLSGAHLSGANLSGANLSGANLSGANLSGANLSGANLSRADLSDAELFRAELIGANLFRTNLFRSELGAANLIAANLIGANLIDVNVESTRFTDCLGISESLKLDLINRGAIFNDSRGDRSRVLTPTPPTPRPVRK